MTVSMDYSERVAAFLAEHPEVAETGVIERSNCGTCGVAMEDRFNATRTDHGWHVVGEVETIDPWERLDHLAEHDVAAYSAAKAHRTLLGSWPWDHNHLPERRTP